MKLSALIYTIFSLEGIVFARKVLDDKDQEPDKRLKKANAIVRDHSFISNGIGLIPMPVVDLVGISASQFAMITRLAKLYDTPIKKSLLKSILSIVVYELSAIGTYKIAVSLFKSVPFIGSLAGPVATSVHATATTLVMGKMFIQHFESGGTLLDFDPKSVKTYFEQEMLNKQQEEAQKQ